MDGHGGHGGHGGAAAGMYHHPTAAAARVSLQPRHTSIGDKLVELLGVSHADAETFMTATFARWSEFLAAHGPSHALVFYQPRCRRSEVRTRGLCAGCVHATCHHTATPHTTPSAGGRVDSWHRGAAPALFVR